MNNHELLSKLKENHLNAINGLEGCRKSSLLFSLAKEFATKESPFLFAFKNYELMLEQKENLIQNYGLKKEEIAICGFNKNYDPAINAYTNKQTPFIMPEESRIIFVTQAILQRNKHKQLQSETFKKIFQHIVVDEFDFTCGIIPTFDYLMGRGNISQISDLKKNAKKDLFRWIKSNYTEYDVFRAQKDNINGVVGFEMAYWIEDSVCPITYLTSEILATTLLRNIGFSVIDYGDSKFEDCNINWFDCDVIGRNFFNKMNKEMVWDKLGFDLIISDCINSDKNIVDYTLDTTVVSHTGARGSNAHKEKKILTIISHIPSSAIRQIQDALNWFVEDERNYSFRFVEALFYRDRIMQAVGRTIGYRGGKEAYLLIHKSIFDLIDDIGAKEILTDLFLQEKNIGDENENTILKSPVEIKTLVDSGVSFLPYNLKPWTFHFEGMEKIFSEIRDLQETYKESQKIREKERNINNRIKRKAVSFSMLEDYYQLGNEEDVMTLREVKEFNKEMGILNINETGPLPALKVQKYFNLKIKWVKREGKNERALTCIKRKVK